MTTRSPLWLLDHRSDVYSQCGEDGVLAKVLPMLPDCTGWCVEFGAGDGAANSNTRALIEGGYSAVLIESHPALYAALAELYDGRVTTLHREVGWGPDDGLDSILADTDTPEAFDLLSIDIDGNDYHAWAAVKVYRPQVVLIEFNHTMPSHVQFVQEADPDVWHGSSLRSLVELGKAKGYELICVFHWNALFVRSELYPLFGISINAPNVLRTELGGLTWLYSGADGQVFLDGSTLLPWHPGARLQVANMQPLPRRLRRPYHTYTPAQRQAYDRLVARQQEG